MEMYFRYWSKTKVLDKPKLVLMIDFTMITNHLDGDMKHAPNFMTIHPSMLRHFTKHLKCWAQCHGFTRGNVRGSLNDIHLKLE